jgi:hypothetical protein
MNRFIKSFPAFAALALLTQPPAVLACAACYGKSDSPLAKGMNWGILSLLAVVVCVLGTFATFFVYLAKKSATTPVDTADSTLPGPNPKL